MPDLIHTRHKTPPGLTYWGIDTIINMARHVQPSRTRIPCTVRPKIVLNGSLYWDQFLANTYSK